MGLHDHARSHAVGRRLRRARARRCRAQGQAVAAAVRRDPGRLGGRRAPVGQRRLDHPVRRPRAHRGRGAAPRPPGAPAGAGATASGWRSTAPTWRRPPRPSPSAPRHHHDRRRDPARQHRPRRLRPRPAAPSCTATAGPTTSCARPGGVDAEAGHPARRLRRRAAHLPGRGARLARLPRRRRARWLPRAGHGPRQDADDARPPRPLPGQRAGARGRAGRGRRQLGVRRPARFAPGLRVVVHHGADRSSRRRAASARSTAPTS